MSTHDMIRIGSNILYKRNLCSFDYDEFIKLTNMKISKTEFVKNYIEKNSIFGNILINPMTFEIVAVAIYENNKMKKVIFNDEYNANEMVKHL